VAESPWQAAADETPPVMVAALTLMLLAPVPEAGVSVTTPAGGVFAGGNAASAGGVVPNATAVTTKTTPAIQRTNDLIIPSTPFQYRPPRRENSFNHLCRIPQE
jgi:hypothetical protein